MLSPQLQEWSAVELKNLLEHLEYFECSDEPLDRDRVLTVLDVLLPISEQLAREYDGLEDYVAPTQGETVLYGDNDGVLSNAQAHLNELNTDLANNLDQLLMSSQKKVNEIRDHISKIANACSENNISHLNKLLIGFRLKVQSLESSTYANVDIVASASIKVAVAARCTMNGLVKFICIFIEDAYKLLSQVEDWNDSLVREYSILEPALMVRQSLESTGDYTDYSEHIRTDQVSNENRYEAITHGIKMIEVNIDLFVEELANFKGGNILNTEQTVKTFSESIDSIRTCISTIRGLDIQADIDHVSRTHQYVSQLLTLLLEEARNFHADFNTGGDRISQLIQLSSNRLKNMEERHKNDIPNMF